MVEVIKKILIVDDEAFVRQSLSDYFEDNLFCVLQAKSGEKALDILETETPEGVIVDVRMGEMSGHSFIRKAIQKEYHTAFLICTGSPDYTIPEDLRKLNCVSDYLCKKPVTDLDNLKNELLKIVNFVMSREEKSE